MDRVVGTPVALRHVEAGALRSGIELSAAPRPLRSSTGRQPRWKMKTLSGDSAKMPGRSQVYLACGRRVARAVERLDVAVALEYRSRHTMPRSCRYR